MRPTRLTVRSFRGVGEEVSLDLSRSMNVIVSPNGRGKSSLLNAVEWALFGGGAAAVKATGIAERQGWVTGFGGRRPDVELVLGDDGGAAVRLRRTEIGRRREKLAVSTSEGEPVVGVAAEEVLQGMGLPSWAEWQLAFCHHQELPRRRIIASGDRAGALGTLLGLEPYARLRQALASLRGGDLLKKVAAGVQRVGDRWESASRPSSDAVLWEEALTRRGLTPAECSEDTDVVVAQRMVARAAQLAEGLGGAGSLGVLPDPEDAAAVRTWAAGLPGAVRRARHEMGGEGLFQSRRRLQVALQHLLEAEGERDRWSEERRVLEREHGTAVELDAALRAAREETERAHADAERRDALRALRERARDQLQSTPSDHCPVCDSEVHDLVARLESVLDAGAAPDVEAKPSGERVQLLAKRRRALEDVRQREVRAESSHAVAVEGLSAELPVGFEGDPRLAARDRLADLEVQIRVAEEFSGRLERELDEHEADVDLLRELAGWRAARARERRSGPQVPDELARACESEWDAASGLGFDLIALAEMAREVEADASERRVEEVHRSIGAFMEPMCGPRWSDVRLHVHRTRTRIGYGFLDAEGLDVLPTMNQASLNALALSVLFASAQGRHQRGLPAFLVLDDPGQSLDEDHAVGLARAIQRVAATVPVLVATPPGRLAESLCDTPLPHRRWDLLQFDPGRGVCAREVSS